MDQSVGCFVSLSHLPKHVTSGPFLFCRGHTPTAVLILDQEWTNSAVSGAHLCPTFPFQRIGLHESEFDYQTAAPKWVKRQAEGAESSGGMAEKMCCRWLPLTSSSFLKPQKFSLEGLQHTARSGDTLGDMDESSSSSTTDRPVPPKSASRRDCVTSSGLSIVWQVLAALSLEF